MALRAVPEHPKFAHLKTLLALPKGALLGWLESIWHFTARFAPQGNIGKFTDKEIEAWVEWNGEPGALIAALTESRWLQRDATHRLLVHDWQEHADKATKQSLKNKSLQFHVPTMFQVGAQLEHTSSFAVQVCAPPVPGPVPVPVPEPVPGAEPVPPQAATPPPPAPRTPVIQITMRDPDAGAELILANWLLEETGVPSDPALMRVVADCVRLWAKENAVTLKQSAEWIAQQAAEARCRGETVNRFWFSDQRYRPVAAVKTQKQREKEARIAAFRKGGDDEGARA